MDLVREILLKIEQYEPEKNGGHSFFRLTPSDLPQRFHSLSPDKLFFHLDLMHQAGLLPADFAPASNGNVAGWLSHNGYVYLNEIRDPVLFAKLLKVLDANIPYPLETVRKIARKLQQEHDRWVIGLVIAGLAFVAGNLAMLVATWIGWVH